MVKKHELLVPAGNMDCLKQAVYHGADAVYLACKSFGARKFAANFDNEEIIEAIHFCHLYGVRLYVTMNILVHNSEVDQFIEQARFLHENGVDALIVQDIGMIYLLRQKFPNLEIHASTQANNSSVDTCKMFYDLGVKRVVFSRELSIDEIDKIDVPIEKEAFIHGALCVSYSGCCLMSSMIGGRSGNRGECAGCCRLPYTLKKGNNVIKKECYPLSMKELNTSSHFQRLLDSSVYSFKIEGRMKGPLYVAFITEFYRRLIDGSPMSLSEEVDKLKTIFNREFTEGHLFGVTGSDLINSKSPNHIGLKIGTAKPKGDKILLEIDNGKELLQHDSIRFLNSNLGMVVNYLYDKKLKLCSSAKSICYVDNKIGLEKEDVLTKTQDSLLEKEYIVDEVQRRIPIEFSLYAKKNQPLFLSISDGTNSFSIQEGRIEEAVNAPTTEDVVASKLVKVGNSPFNVINCNIDLDSNIFIPMTLLNEMRRKLVDQLIECRRYKLPVSFIEEKFSFSQISQKSNNFGLTCLVYDEEQLTTCLKYNFKRIYVNSLELYEKYKNNSNIYFYVSRCNNSFMGLLKEKNLISDSFNYNGNNCYGSYTLNITNIYSAYYYIKMGLLNIPLSVELTDKETTDFIDLFKKEIGEYEFEIYGYGRVENMIIKDNILNIDENDLTYSLTDGRGRCFPVYYDGRLTHIYHEQITNRLTSIKDGCAFIDFYGEGIESIINIINKFNHEKNILK